jgi:hypothetical protein
MMYPLPSGEAIKDRGGNALLQFFEKTRLSNNKSLCDHSHCADHVISSSAIVRRFAEISSSLSDTH